MELDIRGWQEVFDQLRGQRHRPVEHFRSLVIFGHPARSPASGLARLQREVDDDTPTVWRCSLVVPLSAQLRKASREAVLAARYPLLRLPAMPPADLHKLSGKPQVRRDVRHAGAQYGL